MGQPDEYNLHSGMLLKKKKRRRYVKNGSTKAIVFLALKITTKFSIHCGTKISPEISLVPLGVGTTVRLGFGVEF